MTNLDEFIAESKKHHYIELTILNKIIKALNAADDPIVAVWDGDELTPVTPGNKKEIHRLVFNLDECWLKTRSKAFVYFVLGNEWDCISDYTLRLEPVLKSINDFIDEHSR